MKEEAKRTKAIAVLDFFNAEEEGFEKNETEEFFEIKNQSLIIHKFLKGASLQSTIVEILKKKKLDSKNIIKIQVPSLQKPIDKDIQYIANTFNNLQYLSIDSASDITDSGLQYLNELKALETLRLYTVLALPKITQQGLLDFAFSHPNAEFNLVKCSEINQVACMKTIQEKVKVLNVFWNYNPLKEPTKIEEEIEQIDKVELIEITPSIFFASQNIEKVVAARGYGTSLIKSITDKVLGIDILDYPYMAGTALVATNTLIAFCNPYLAVFAYLVVNTAVAYKLDSLPESFVNIIDNASARVMNCRNRL